VRFCQAPTNNVNAIFRCPIESPLRVPEKRSAFHQRVQRTAFRRRDVRRRQTLFALHGSRLRHNPQDQPALLRLSAIIFQYYTRFDSGLYFKARDPFSTGVPRFSLENGISLMPGLHPSDSTASLGGDSSPPPAAAKHAAARRAAYTVDVPVHHQRIPPRLSRL
jgi:hypothetical protein